MRITKIQQALDQKIAGNDKTRKLKYKAQYLDGIYTLIKIAKRICQGVAYRLPDINLQTIRWTAQNIAYRYAADKFDLNAKHQWNVFADVF